MHIHHIILDLYGLLCEINEILCSQITIYVAFTSLQNHHSISNCMYFMITVNHDSRICDAIYLENHCFHFLCQSELQPYICHVQCSAKWNWIWRRTPYHSNLKLLWQKWKTEVESPETSVYENQHVGRSITHPKMEHLKKTYI
jgi:hypothetical protein